MRSPDLRIVVALGLLLGSLGCDQKKTPATDNETSASSETSSAKAPEETSKPSETAAKTTPKKQSEQFAFTATSHAVKVGEKATVAFEIKPGSGLKINPEYPWKASIDGDGSSPEVAVTSAKIAKDAMQLEEAGAKIPIELTASKAGEHKLAATVSFSVCEKGDQARCLMFRDEPVEITVAAAQ